MGTERVEKLANLLLEQYDECDNTHANQFVEDGAHQTHLEHLTDKQPDEHKHHDSDEHVQRTALFHQPVDVIEHQGYQQDINGIFYSKIERHYLLVESSCSAMLRKRQSRADN